VHTDVFPSYSTLAQITRIWMALRESPGSYLHSPASCLPFRVELFTPYDTSLDCTRFLFTHLHVHGLMKYTLIHIKIHKKHIPRKSETSFWSFRREIMDDVQRQKIFFIEDLHA